MYRLSLSLLAAIALVLMAGGPVSADDPSSSGTGIPAVDNTGNWTPEQMGYTAVYAALKEAAASGDIAANGVIGGTYRWSLADYSGSDSVPVSIYHQKLDYYCLVAVGQSILEYKFNGYASPTIRAGQDTIADGMDTDSGGTLNGPAIAYVNGEFAAHSSGWRYVNWESTSISGFSEHVMWDINSQNMPMYVRVNLGNGYYAWHTDHKSIHATLAVGYSGSGDYARSADPWSHEKTDGTCNHTWDDGAASFGCVWGAAPNPLWDMSDYYRARHLGSANPEWL